MQCCRLRMGSWRKVTLRLFLTLVMLLDRLLFSAFHYVGRCGAVRRGFRAPLSWDPAQVGIDHDGAESVFGVTSTCHKADTSPTWSDPPVRIPSCSAIQFRLHDDTGAPRHYATATVSRGQLLDWAKAYAPTVLECKVSPRTTRIVTEF